MRSRSLFRSGLLLLGLLGGALGLVGAAEIRVDASATNGLIRALHGVNLGPLCYRGVVDLTQFHREIGVPLTRLHDVVWVNADAVDVSTIFRDFRNDPEQPESYDFATTDDYLQAVADTGAGIVYRLGESIEHTARKYRVNPPRDPEKWAKICLGIVRHYQAGWANGYRGRVRYWEIWNEPDVRPAMWTGSEEEFLRLYEVTAKAIKSEFPELKVGGPALGGTGEFRGNTFEPSAFCTRFLSYCRDRQVPLDFFSWHRYTSDPWDLPRRARAMRETLNRFGFASAESHLNEWNYLPRDDWRPMLKEGQGRLREQWYQEMGGPAGAAFATCALSLLQDVPLDAANYYTGEIQGFGLFNYHGVPKKSYYAFLAFHRLLETPLRLQAGGGLAGQWTVCAGRDAGGSRVGILVSRWQGGGDPIRVRVDRLPWPGASVAEILQVDDLHDLAKTQELRLPETEETIPLSLKAPFVALLQLRPAP